MNPALFTSGGDDDNNPLLHRSFNRLRGRPAEDSFPTRYRANTAGAIRRLARATGFHTREIRFVESRPEYLRISAPTYLAGWLYERCVNATPHLAPLRVVLACALQRRAMGSP